MKRLRMSRREMMVNSTCVASFRPEFRDGTKKPAGRDNGIGRKSDNRGLCCLRRFLDQAHKLLERNYL